MYEKVHISGPVYYEGTDYRVSSSGEMIEYGAVASLVKIDEIDGDKDVWLYVSNKYISFDEE